MRLSAFIAGNKESIVQDWEDFARTIYPAAHTMDRAALRNDVGFILDAIVVDLDTPQTADEQIEKSKGASPKADLPSFAQNHASERLASGFTVHQLVSEYRALRASVLRLWAANSQGVMWSDAGDATRFNEAVDQAMAESILRYSLLVESTMTDQKLTEADLRESNQYKDEFLAMLAHELRNPLAPISTAAQLLGMSPGNETMVRQVSEVINRQTLHLTNIVDDLLDVSRLTRGLIELHTEPVDVKLIATNAIEQAQPLIEARHQSMVLKLGSTPAFVEGDKTRLVQVVSNLLNNAAKYTPHKGEIVVALEVSDEQVHLAVSDNGSGIAPKLMPHIFELFTQAERTPDRTQGGLGLGLSLVKNIVALHNGEVKASSDGIGKGSVFTVTLPLIKKQSAKDAVKVPFVLCPSKPAVQGQEMPWLMIVEDNRDAGQLLASLLEAKGYQVVVHETAESALNDALLPKVQVFILDIGLPKMDGNELAGRLRANSITQKAILIALTGYGQPQQRVMAKAAGFDHYFVKPIHLHQLTELLAKLNLSVRGPEDAHAV